MALIRRDQQSAEQRDQPQTGLRALHERISRRVRGGR